MKKCKVCGECFSHHVSNAHIVKHGLTRKEYNAIKERETIFNYGKNTISEKMTEYKRYKGQRISMSNKAKSSASRCFNQV